MERHEALRIESGRIEIVQANAYAILASHWRTAHQAFSGRRLGQTNGALTKPE